MGEFRGKLQAWFRLRVRDGHDNAYNLATVKCFPEKYPGKEALKACLESPTVTPFDFGKIRLGQLADGVDEFYKDFRNKSIDINLAMFYVRDELKGKPAKELEDELTQWRRQSSH